MCFPKHTVLLATIMIFVRIVIIAIIIVITMVIIISTTRKLYITIKIKQW